MLYYDQRLLIAAIIAWLALFSYSSTAQAQTSLQSSDCPAATGVFGRPLDYTDPTSREPRSEYGPGKTYLSIVENVHFTGEIETLLKGNTSTDPLGDILYTLNAFPNHHRALWAASRLQFKQGKPLKPTAECLLERAIRFKPLDAVVHTIYGAHLHKSGKINEAIQQYQIAEKINPNWSELQYNMGLLYLEIKQYAQAKQHAQRAYQLGYPLPGLRNKLKQVGQWP